MQSFTMQQWGLVLSHNGPVLSCSLSSTFIIFLMSPVPQRGAFRSCPEERDKMAVSLQPDHLLNKKNTFQWDPLP